jgi:Tat protein secretion system quality control protein TatD with DNase activity
LTPPISCPKLLEQYPDSIVGEIGLDKVAKAPNLNKVLWDEQIEVFTSIFDIACELKRPVSVRHVSAPPRSTADWLSALV